MSPSAPPASYQVEHLEDFTKHAWCNKLLSDPTVTKIQKRSMPPPHHGGSVSNSFFTKTLFTDSAVRAFLSLYRPGTGVRAQITASGEGDNQAGNEQPSSESTAKKEKIYAPDEPGAPEGMILVSLGSDVDGGKGRLHGGVIATLLDQVMGLTLSYSHDIGSVTAGLNVTYKKPVLTPTVLLIRGRIVREVGRWTELMGWVEDGEGNVYAEGRGSFVKNKVTDPDRAESKL